MKNESFPTFESIPKIVTAPPAIESLLTTEDQQNFWSEDVRNNYELQEQAKRRNLLSKSLGTLCDQIPEVDTNIWDGFKEGLVDSSEIVNLYNLLSDLLEHDSTSKRIILYLPFEFLPQQKVFEQCPKESPLSFATERFLNLFKKTWNNLLETHDIRADFFDGDIIEPEHRATPPEKVVKAAHLIPELVKRDILSVREVLEILERTQDAILESSIADTLPVLLDLDLITDDALLNMSQSKKRLVSNMAIILRSQETKYIQPKKESSEENIKNIDSSMRKDRAHILDEYETNNPKITASRKKWLKEKRLDQSIKTHTRRVKSALAHNTINHEDLLQYAKTHHDDVGVIFIANIIGGILEENKGGKYNNNVSQNSEYIETLVYFWKNQKNAEVLDSIEGIFLHLFAQGILKKSQLEQLGIHAPTTEISFSEIESSIRQDLDDIGKITCAIETDTELFRLVYPVALIFGSRIKGYAKNTADLDIGVFVRPKVPFTERQHLQELLQKTFVHKKIQDRVMEFWLQENGQDLSICDFRNPDTALGDSSLTHVLLGAWRGNESIIREIHKRLLTGYLYSEGKKIQGQDAQQVWIEDIEHNVLQYRLMHKGYERLFPRQEGIHTLHSDDIDGESVFYDSGYRRVATKLFVKHVFLPQLKKPTTS